MIGFFVDLVAILVLTALAVPAAAWRTRGGTGASRDGARDRRSQRVATRCAGKFGRLRVGRRRSRSARALIAAAYRAQSQQP